MPRWAWTLTVLRPSLWNCSRRRCRTKPCLERWGRHRPRPHRRWIRTHLLTRRLSIRCSPSSRPRPRSRHPPRRAILASRDTPRRRCRTCPNRRADLTRPRHSISSHHRNTRHRRSRPRRNRSPHDHRCPRPCNLFTHQDRCGGHGLRGTPGSRGNHSPHEALHLPRGERR